MALFNCNFRISQTSKVDSEFSPTYSNLLGTAETSLSAKQHGIINAPGFISGKHLHIDPVPTEWIARWTNSDISGYLKLTTAFSRINKDLVYLDFHTVGVTFPEYSAWEEFSTDAGAMDGFIAYGDTVTFALTAWKDVAGAGAAVTMEVEAFIRATDGTETSIATYTENINVTTATQFTQDVNITQTWGTNERFVMKYRFKNEGIV